MAQEELLARIVHHLEIVSSNGLRDLEFNLFGKDCWRKLNLSHKAKEFIP